jgi:NAD(P)-dependent dehydrogenase (short-subunit alcohol dehydrogenase family)
VSARTFVVTGANRGLGLELARQLVARGERVIATARDPRRAGPLAELDARVLPLDVGDDASIAAFAAALGGAPIDVLVNNAGRGDGRQPLGALARTTLRDTLETNALGPLLVTQALLPNLRAAESRLVVQITSKMGSIDDNTSGGAYGYRASKAALNMLNKSLALDLAAEGFRCVLLHPGWVRTDMGGASAPLSVQESVAGMLAVIDGLGPQHSGAFLDFRGETIAW